MRLIMRKLLIELGGEYERVLAHCAAMAPKSHTNVIVYINMCTFIVAARPVEGSQLVVL